MSHTAYRLISYWRLSVLALCCVLSPAKPACAQQPQKPLTKADVIKMVRNAVPAPVIVSALQANPTNFDISADGLSTLQKAGVPQKVMDAMVKAESSKRSSGGSVTSSDPAARPSSAPPVQASPASASPTGSYSPMTAASVLQESQPVPTSGSVAVQPGPSTSTSIPGQASVAFVSENNRQEIPVEKTQLAETKNKPTSMTSLAADSALTQALQTGVNTAMTEAVMHSTSTAANTALGQAGGIFAGMLAKRKPAITYVWALAGPNSPNVAPANSPTIVVNFAGVPGINAAEFEPAIVKLTPSANNFRLVGATQGKENASASSTVDWQVYTGFLEDRVPVQAQRLSAGQYQITPPSVLVPGEYAIVLRPISKTKKFSGGDVARCQGDGLTFDSVWSFQVK